jgi:ABC-type branched-subunit amino acid transport system substrate-binding protein
MHRFYRIAFAFLLSLGLASQANAASKGAREIVFGAVLPLTGPFSTLGRPLAEGASAYFDMLNANGGFNGHQIRFELMDDTFDPKLTVAKTEELIAKYSPVALLNIAGSAQNAALIQSGVLKRARIAVIGARDGSAAVRELKSPNHFFLIAGISAEADKIVNVSTTIGRKRLGVIYTDDASGLEALHQMERAAKSHGATVVQQIAIPDGGPIDDAARRLAADKSLQQVVIFGVTPVVANFYKTMKSLGAMVPVTTFSTASHAGIVDLLGPEMSRGLMVSQVTYPLSNTIPVMKEFRAAMDMEQIPELRISSLHLEGYLAARVAVEALKRIPDKPTSEGMMSALEALGKTNIGGVSYDFSNGRREGSSFVQIGIISSQGKLVN